MGKIEEFIRENRKDLDVYEPAPGIWRSIRNEVSGGGRSKIWWLTAAAMIFVVFGSAILYYIYDNNTSKIISPRESEALVMRSDTWLRESEIYYNNLANDLFNEAEPFLTGHPHERRELLTDLSRLDSICCDIRRDLRDNVANQEVIEALINNYRLKIRILEEMLLMVKQNDNNNNTKESHAL